MRSFYMFIALLHFLSLHSQTQPVGEDKYVIQDSVLIPTRSGIDISAIIVRKKTNLLPLPAILFYTTYHQGAGDAILGKRAANRDYVGIVAYARGIRTDLKNYKPFENEEPDIYDIIEWISHQPWCNGSVGMYGGSYTGFAQWSAIKNMHPALKTIVPQVAVMPGYDFPMENNVPLSHILAWSNDNIYKNQPLRRSVPFDYFNSGVAYKKLDSLADQQNPIFQKWLDHPSYDHYWLSLVPSPNQYAELNIPILTTTGYYDGSQIAALRYFKLHNKYNNQANHYMVIGPYDHWGGQRNASKNLMGYNIDSIADFSMLNLAFDWLDFILKGAPKPALLKDKINYQVMGTNTWKHASKLQDINNDTLIFYLDKSQLTPKKPKKKSFKSQIIDMKDRENQNNFYTPSIIFDSLDVSNGLVFTTAPFDHDFFVNGSFAGNLFATINKKDIDISMGLYEIMPDNKYFFITRYVGRASYAKDNTKRTLLRPNQKESIPFDNTRFVSKKISKGSRLVILLNINKHPFEIINYGSGKKVSTETINDAGKPLHIKWHNDSYITIPVHHDN